MFTVSPVPGTYRSRFRHCFGDDPLYIKYEVTGKVTGYSCRFSISKLSDGCYSLVDFGDARQKDKHYTTWERAYQGMLCICRRRFAMEYSFAGGAL